jgi:hypothetical protein
MEVREALGITKIPLNLCPIPKLPDQMPIDFCTNICDNPCQAFIDFEFVTRFCTNADCNNDDANPSTVCEQCLRDIEKYKTYMRCQRVLDMDEVDRYRTFRFKVEKYLKKHGLK